MLQLGIDLGGTKISACVLGENEKIRFHHRLATPHDDYQETIARIVQLVSQAEAECGQACSIGIGTPGSASAHSGAMRNCNSTCLNGRYLQHDLEDALGRQIKLANDANCFALSEALDGAAQEYSTVLGVILGTGVGSGIVIGQRLLHGKNAIAGEWGHNYFPAAAAKRESRECYCGKNDCVETWLSGPGLQRSYKQESGHKDCSVERIVELAAQKDLLACRILDQYTVDLAIALSTVMNILDPDAIVLGGGVGQVPGLCEGVAKALAGNVFSDHFATPVLLPRFGADSGVRGAARLHSL